MMCSVRLSCGFTRKQREIAETGMLGQDRRDLVRRHLAHSALGADVGAGGRSW